MPYDRDLEFYAAVQEIVLFADNHFNSSEEMADFIACQTEKLMRSLGYKKEVVV